MKFFKNVAQIKNLQVGSVRPKNAMFFQPMHWQVKTSVKKASKSKTKNLIQNRENCCANSE